jgi:hypothetical protein
MAVLSPAPHIPFCPFYYRIRIGLCLVAIAGIQIIGMLQVHTFLHQAYLIRLLVPLWCVS